MYGTIFNLNIKPGHEKALLAALKEETTSKPEGMVAWFVMNPDDEGDLVGIAVFKDKESYRSNAERSEQHKNFMEMMQYLDQEPSWNDGTFVIGDVV